MDLDFTISESEDLDLEEEDLDLNLDLSLWHLITASLMKGDIILGMQAEVAFLSTTLIEARRGEAS